MRIGRGFAPLHSARAFLERKKITVTRKDYELLASVMRGALEAGGDSDTLFDVSLRFANACEGGNARFDRKRFLKACGWSVA